MFRSASVTSAAISMSRSDRRSRPVISQSIHTNSSRTAIHPSARRPVVFDGQIRTTRIRALQEGSAMTEATATPAQQIAAGYDTTGQALELGSVMVAGTCDPTARIRIPLAMMNRHGLVAGATGTGKTKTLQLIAEQLSAAGVPVVMADFGGRSVGPVAARRIERQDRGARPGHRRRLGGHTVPGGVLSLGTGGLGIPCGRRFPPSARSCCRRCWGSARIRNQPRSDLHYADQQGPTAARTSGPAVGDHLPDQHRRGQGPAESLGAVSSQTAGVILRALIGLQAEGRRHLLRRARTRARRPDPVSTLRKGHHQPCSNSATRPPGR